MTNRPSRALSLAAASMAVGGLSLVAAASLLLLQDANSTTSKPVQLAPADPSETSCHQRCALPLGVRYDGLSQTTADYLAKRAQLCADFECGRVDAEGYSEAIAALDKEPTAPLPERLWATSVRGVSSQYGDDNWSAGRVLGEPDVYPAHRDDIKAWASVNADSKNEFIEVGIPAAHIAAVEVYETFNPGAVRGVDLILRDGTRHRVGVAEPSVARKASRINTTTFPCTQDEVVAVAVVLNPAAVPGWNEIDAIAVRPCR